MPPDLDLSTTVDFQLWQSGKHRFHYLTKCLQHYYSTPVIATISTSDTMANEWYMDVGVSAARIASQAFHNSWLGEVKLALDMACGHGRVLRHLINLFPDAQFHACDLDGAGVEFCRETFGVKGIHSVEDLTAVDFGVEYDLIWVGSLFTHTSREITGKWLEHLTKFLSPSGILIATFHGRWSEQVGKRHSYINPEAWAEIVDEYRATGYGYRDYEKPENHNYIVGSYGISLSRPSAVIDIAESIPGIRVFSYQERAWADHQDVLVVGRPAFDKQWS